MADGRDEAGAALEAALQLAAEEGWRAATLARVAARAEVPLNRLRALYPSRGALLDAFARAIDEAVLAGGPPEEAETARERLFEIMMRRFDALGPHRRALASIAAATRADPSAALAGCMRLHASMRWMLEAAAIDGGGLAGGARAAVLAAIHLDVLRVWLDDDSEDMASTMAALDRRLARAEALVEGWRRCRPPRRRGQGSDRQDDPGAQAAQG